MVLPLPNCPTSLKPQVYTSPVLLNAITWSTPADILTMFDKYSLELIFTLTGFERLMVVPSPHCPLLFNPTVQTVPSAFKKTLKVSPCEISGIVIAFSLFWITYTTACAWYP